MKMKRFKVITLAMLFGLTCAQPVSKESSENMPKSEEMVKLLRNSLEKSAHTYGMNLNSNIGYVWNNIGNSTPVLHHFGIINQPENSQKPANLTEKKPPQILEELLNYEEFWRWLSDWSTMYMQALTDYLAKEIRAEVEKEVQLYFSILETEDYIKKMDKINADRVRDQLYLEVKHKLIEEGLLSGSNDDKNANDFKEVIKKAVHEEIEALRRNKDKEIKLPNNPVDLKVEADKIYGNSVGNEKVVNIFVFNPNPGGVEQLENVANGSFGGEHINGQESFVVGDEAKPIGSEDIKERLPIL